MSLFVAGVMTPSLANALNRSKVDDDSSNAVEGASGRIRQ
jgi:hypothetical protein